MMNFHIVENDNSKYDEFVELYNDYSIDTATIKQKIGSNSYLKLRKEALENGDIKQRPSNIKRNQNHKFYHFDKNRGKYRVRKVRHGKYMCFGFYDTENEAKQVVEQLKAVDWDKSRL